MKTYCITVFVIICLLTAGQALAGHIDLKPIGFVATTEASDKPISGGALTFDLSQIPKDSRIDLAELKLSVNSDTSLGKHVEVFVGAAITSWTSSLLPLTSKVATADSLLADNFLLTGDGQPVEIEVTDIVKLWHSGKLANNGFVISIPGDGRKGFAVATKGVDVEVCLSVFFSK